MAADGFADDNCLPTTGGAMLGPLNFQGNPPYTLTSDFLGSVTLTGTTPVSVAAPKISAASYVFLFPQPGGSGTAGSASVASITPGTGFSVVSTSSSDARVLAWMIVTHA